MIPGDTDDFILLGCVYQNSQCQWHGGVRCVLWTISEGGWAELGHSFDPCISQKKTIFWYHEMVFRY